jgi:hypothetical protein
MARDAQQGAFLKLDTGTHTRAICQLIVSPDRSKIISAGDTSIRVWDAKTLRLQRLLLSHVARPPDQAHLYGHVLRMALHPVDGRSLVALKVIASPQAQRQAGLWATELQLFDTETGSLQARFLHRGGPRHVDFSPDGRFLVLSCRDAVVEIHAWSRLVKAGFGAAPTPVARHRLRSRPRGQPGMKFDTVARFIPGPQAQARTYGLVVALSTRSSWHDAKGHGELLWASFVPAAGLQVQRSADVGADIDPATLSVSPDWAVVATYLQVQEQGQPVGRLRAQRHRPDRPGRPGSGAEPWVDLSTEYLVAATCFAPSGARLLLGMFAPESSDPGLDTFTAQAYTVNAQGFTLRSTYHGHDHSVGALAFLTDDRALSSGGDSEAIHLWDTRALIGQRVDAIRGVGRTVFNVHREGEDLVVFDTVPERTLPHSRLRRQRTFSLTTLQLGFTEPRLLPPPRHAVGSDWSGLQLIPVPPLRPQANGDVDRAHAGELSLFVGSDDEWVLWTRSGYYDASPKGAQRIGYHVNRGQNQAAVFLPGDRMKGFYRPDIVQAVLLCGSEAGVAKMARTWPADLAPLPRIRRLDVARLVPPVIELEGDPVGGRDRVRLSFTARPLGVGQPPSRVFVLRNGRFAWQARHPVLPKGGVFRVSLPLGPGRNEFSIRSENASARAVPVDFTIEGPPMAPKGGPDYGARGNLYLLSVGVSQFLAAYQNDYKPLKAAHRDATAVYNALACSVESTDFDENRPLRNAAFDAVQAKLLVNQQATRRAIGSALAQFRRQMLQRKKAVGKERDVLVIFLAGHGVIDLHEGALYFLNHDLSFQNMELTGLAFRDLGEWVADVPAEVVFIIDACHSQMSAQGLDQGLSPDAVARRLQQANERSLYVLSAARTDQKARESDEHGVFTQALLDTWRSPRYLQPDADGKTLSLSVTGLMDGLQAEVPRVAARWNKGEQTPVFRNFGDLLPLTLFRR